jgi:hypothetical protein
MMKKLIGILALIFLIMLGINTAVMAQNEVQMQITMFKDVSLNGETYGISFDVSGEKLRNVTRVLIDGPRGRRIPITNPLKLNLVSVSVDNLSLDDFGFWFPEGDYKITLTPPSYGKLKVHMTHHFPSTPAVLYPLEGSADVPTNLVITWAPITSIMGLRLELKNDAGFAFGIELPINATSYTVPLNLLRPNAGYQLLLEAKVTDFTGNGLITTQTISFATKAQ